jgi:hypothetical protein
MADDDKGKDSGSNGIFTNDPFLNIAAAIIILLLVFNFVQMLPSFLSEVSTTVKSRVGSLSGLYSGLYVASVLFSAACFAGAIYAGIQKGIIAKAEKKEYEAMTKAAISGERTQNDRWEHVLTHAASDDEELWRLAIIEADVMLDEMLQVMGYTQDSLGEKLRSADTSSLKTLDQAWSAHKLRNTIAHEGSSYNLSRREVDVAIDNYRQVFNEFSFI